MNNSNNFEIYEYSKIRKNSNYSRNSNIQLKYLFMIAFYMSPLSFLFLTIFPIHFLPARVPPPPWECDRSHSLDAVSHLHEGIGKLRKEVGRWCRETSRSRSDLSFQLRKVKKEVRSISIRFTASEFHPCADTVHPQSTVAEKITSHSQRFDEPRISVATWKFWFVLPRSLKRTRLETLRTRFVDF